MKTLNLLAESAIADRLGGLDFGKTSGGYKFALIKDAKAAAIKANPGIDLIDMGVGEPDNMADVRIVDKLYSEAKKWGNRTYADNGTQPFKNAAAQFMQNHYGVTLDPTTEIIHSIGSKCALGMLAACLINPGDIVLMTSPGYGVFGTHAQYYGGHVVQLPLSAENDFLPNLQTIPADIIKKAKVLVLNYPNNPTGACASYEYFSSVVAWALQNQIVIIQDAAYATLNHQEDPVSILQVPDAKLCAIELHSLSKSHNMTGWRIGWVCGNAHLVRAYGAVKDNTDSGQFLAIQHAAAYALSLEDVFKNQKLVYWRKLSRLCEILSESGFDAKLPRGGFFLYVKSPQSILYRGKSYPFKTAQECSEWLIGVLGLVTVPWDDCGSYLRFSVTTSEDNIEKLRDRLREIRIG